MTEEERLRAIASGDRRYRAWGAYLPYRQWGTVREDYSAHGDPWGYFPHDHARSRAYRWGEDGLFGLSDERGRVCFAFAFWNEADPILKERLFGVDAAEGNHGESVKEIYFHEDATPTHSYLRARYVYPIKAYPYARLVEESRRRSVTEPEVSLEELGALAEGHFDISVEYAKADAEDLCIRVTIENVSARAAAIVVLPTLWLKNVWAWEDLGPRPRLRAESATRALVDHRELGRYALEIEAPPAGVAPWLFTENETNGARLFGVGDDLRKKDAFHLFVCEGRTDALQGPAEGSKAAQYHRYALAPGERRTLRARLRKVEPTSAPAFDGFDAILEAKRAEADAFYAARFSRDEELSRIARRAAASLLWSEKHYSYDVGRWLDGDPLQPKPPEERHRGRNHEHRHVRIDAVMSLPDAWEYPWFAAWDSGFQSLALALVDGDCAKEQVALYLRDGAIGPRGELPAQEFSLGDVNPPVLAWAAAKLGEGDDRFARSVFGPLLLHYAYWTHRLDPRGEDLYAAGFLGLDNIAPFDRGSAPPLGERLIEADATAWMGVFSMSLLRLAIQLGEEELALYLLGRFERIATALNASLWSEEEGLYLDHVVLGPGRLSAVRVRSLVGLAPLFASTRLARDLAARLPRLARALQSRFDGDSALLSLVPNDRKDRLFAALFDETDFLSPFGARSVSKRHLEAPYVLTTLRGTFRVDYTPGDSQDPNLGKNSNWRGPVWMPLNYMLVEALYAHRKDELAKQLSSRLIALFREREGRIASVGPNDAFPRELRFHELFHGDTGRGLGAAHQTGWTALVMNLIAESRANAG